MTDVEQTVNETMEPKELRDAFNRIKVERDTLLSENRSLKATSVFKELGLPAKHAELYLKVKGDEPITAESVGSFITDYSLAPSEQTAPAPENQPAPTPVDQTASLAGMAGAAGNPSLAGVASGQKMTQAEFQKMLLTDPTGATRAYVEGRVQTVEGNPVVSQAKRQGLIR
jgi:hypothetical protein